MQSSLDLRHFSLDKSVVQYATRTVLKTTGYVAMIVGGDSLINSIHTLVFIGLAQTSESMS